MQSALRAVEKKQLPHMLCVTNMLLHGIEDPGFVRHDNTLARPYIGWERKDRVDIVLTNPPFGGKEEDGIESNFPQHFRTRETADLFLALIVRLLKPGGRAAVVLPDGSLFGEGVKTRLKEHLMEECNLHTIVRLPNSVFRPYASIGTNLLFFEKGETTRDIWFYEHRVPEGQKAYSMTRPIRLEHLQPCIDWWGGVERKGREETEPRLECDGGRDQGARLQPRHQEPAHARGRSRRSAGASEGTHYCRGQSGGLARQLEGDSGGGADPMNAGRLLAHYEKIADAPDAIPRLRRFILDLAVRGKLVEQNPNDEPASELLKRIASEKARLVKAGQIKATKALPPVDEPPFEVPKTWLWARIRQTSSDRGQKVPEADFTYIDVTSIDKENGVVASPKVVPVSKAPSRARKLVRKGDVVYSCVRPYLLNVAVVDDAFDPPPIASTAFAVLNGHGCVLPRFQWIVLRSSFMVACVEEGMRGQAYPAINDTGFRPVALPPPTLSRATPHRRQSR